MGSIAEPLAPLDMNRSTFAFVTQTGPEADPTLAMGHFDKKSTSAAVPIHVRPASQFTTTAAGWGRHTSARLDLGAIAGLLQWYAVLAAWGLAPLVLWR